MSERPIIIGVDGTDMSTAALRWAAREAEHRGVPLRIVHVLDWDWNSNRYDFGGTRFETARRLAERVPASAARTALDVAPGIGIETDVLIGNPAARLIDIEDADLLVVGHRGRGGFAGLLLGSVSQRAATHASCPVVVVRGRADVAEGPIVAGVDDSDSADAALETAFDAAATAGCGLTVIRTYLPAAALYLAPIAATQVHSPEQDAEERDRLLAQVAPWRDKYPGVPVETLLSHDSAAAVLTGVSHSARLVIVGSHGHGALAGTLLGSTGLQLLHHADCPVHIVRRRRQR
ncbi:universal stress protein [Actinoplanes sp. NPDC024001]|uniref:universal stress protein n=1 Tax=Actinoplanes sp. NPDC024001 TaxID=3154598 RepID=UPI0033CC77BB